jgi:putative transposase
MVQVVKTVKCKVLTTPDQTTVFWETLRAFAEACNEILQVSKENSTTNKISLQRLCYRTIKEKYALQANLVIRAIARVSEACRAARKLGRSQPRRFGPTAISLDQRTFSFNEKGWVVSVSTIRGRLKLPLVIGDYRNACSPGKNRLPPFFAIPNATNAFISISLSERRFNSHCRPVT